VFARILARQRYLSWIITSTSCRDHYGETTVTALQYPFAAALGWIGKLDKARHPNDETTCQVEVSTVRKRRVWLVSCLAMFAGKSDLDVRHGFN
jgi:hypothetical protein